MDNLTIQTFDDFIGSQTKPILVDFWAEWCGPCLQLFPILEELSESDKRFVIAKVDVVDGDNMELAKKYNVQNIPTMILFSPEGIILTRLHGFQRRDKILDKIGKYVIRENL